MSEQDTYNSHLGNLGISEERRDKAKAALKAYDLKNSTGSEVDRYESHFKWERPDRTIDTSWSSPGAVGSSGPLSAAGLASKAEQEALDSRFAYPRYRSLDMTTIGILKSTILPSLGLQSGLSILAYGASNMTNRLDGKDWVWPAGQVIQAWWSAIGTQVIYDKVDASTAYSALDYPHKLILFGVTLWGGRLFYRVVSRSIARGHDDERYEKVKEEPDFWGKSLFTIFLPEAVFQTIISLPFTLPFKETQHIFPSSVPASSELAMGLGIFSFCAGFALEVLADVQRAEYSEKRNDLDKNGVWSIVRHPNFLGDALVHASFPLVLYGAGLMHPLAALGPIANYILLRYVGGDKEKEAYQEQKYFKDKSPKYSQLQEYKAVKNSFWPNVDELQNPWLWSVVTIGVAGVMIERVIGRSPS